MSGGRLTTVYRSLERGQMPSAETVPSDDEGGPRVIVATSQRGDVVVAERVDGTDATYDMIRVEPVNESNSQQVQRHVQSGGTHPVGRPALESLL